MLSTSKNLFRSTRPFSTRGSPFPLSLAASDKTTVRSGAAVARSARLPANFRRRPKRRKKEARGSRSVATAPVRFRKPTNRREKFPAPILFIFHFFSFFASRGARKPPLFRVKAENFGKTFFRPFKIEKLRKIYRLVDQRAVAVVLSFDVDRRTFSTFDAVFWGDFAPVVGSFSEVVRVPSFRRADKKRRVSANETRRRQAVEALR